MSIIREREITFVTDSDQETIALAQRLGQLLSEGDVIALVGPLGSGKTWFTKGLGLGLGVGGDSVITSPSFTLVNEYKGRYTIYHMDFYRLDTLGDVFSAGLEEYLHEKGVVVLEWADKWPEILPPSRLLVRFRIVDDQRREIILSGHHPRAMELIGAIQPEEKG